MKITVNQKILQPSCKDKMKIISDKKKQRPPPTDSGRKNF